MKHKTQAKGVYVSPLMGIGVCVFMCVWVCASAVSSVLMPTGVLVHYLTHSREKNFHSSFTLTHTGKFAEAMMMQIWPRCVSSDLRIRVSTTSTFTARRSWVSNTRLGQAFDVESLCSAIGLRFHTASKHMQLLAWLLQAGCPCS